MKLSSQQLNIWKKNNNFFSLKFILVYGPDEGGIDLTATQAIKDFANGAEANVLKLDYKAASDDFSAIANELNNISLFGDLKIVVINDCPPSLPKGFLEFLIKANFAGKLILKSGELKPTSNLRKTAEVHKQALSIACYKEDDRQIQIFITSYLKEHQAKFDDDVPRCLTELLCGNKLLIVQELDKLMLYKLNEQITLKDVENVISDTHEMALDDLCLAVAENNKIKIIKLLEQAKNADTSFMLILRVMQRYFNRILEVLAMMENGSSLDSAIGRLMPPVFYKQKDNLIRVCKISNKQKILAMIADLVKLELDCKRLPLDQYMLINNFFNLRISSK